MMESAAAYLRACLGAKQGATAAAATEEGAVPTKEDMRRTMGNVGEAMEEDQHVLYALTYGTLEDLLAACRDREKRAYSPCGAAAAAGVGVAAPGPGVVNPAEDKEEEDKKKEDAKKEEEDVGLFIIFG